MNYYVIPAQRVPVLVFAHKHHTRAAQWRLGRIPGLFEITYVKAGTLVLTGEEETLRVPPGGVACLSHDRGWLAGNPEGEHLHYTAAFRVDAAGLSPQFREGEGACLPQVLAPENGADILTLLCRLIGTPADDRLRAGALIMTLLSEITAEARPAGTRGNRICRLAKGLVRENLDRAVSPSELAEKLGVSYGHLSRVFKQEEEMTLTEYINRKRLERVCDILFVSDMTLERAGESAGFQDVKYLSRLFRKTYGMSAREYIASIRSHPAG
ncbi:MAG TPA: AraC family transcriptional regulator [Firmicutes bacterium]|nr:AraC family transcriptional regulator [Bacillota bacterium]